MSADLAPAVDVKAAEPPICEDHDTDCADIGATEKGFQSHLECFLYDPQRGFCPFLRPPDPNRPMLRRPPKIASKRTKR